MKELKFSTSKGEFLLLDGKDTITERLTELLKEYEHYAVVKEMTEEQFAEVVEHYNFGTKENPDIGFRNYTSTAFNIDTGSQSFSSIVRSKGWYLWENPVQVSIASLSEKEQAYRQLDTDWWGAESKTLYSPILLKKI